MPLLTAAGVGIYWFLFLRPYDLAESHMPQGTVTLTEDTDGTLTLTWPEAQEADDYIVEIGRDGTSYWRAVYTEPRCVIPTALELPEGVELTVTCRRQYETPRDVYMRPCDDPLTVDYPAELPRLDDLTDALDAELDTLTLTWSAVKGGVYTITDGQGRQVMTTREGRAVIAFGKDVPMPAKDETVSYTVSCALEGTGVEFTSGVSAQVQVDGEDLRGTVLLMDMEELGNNYYTLSWNETRGERYEIQELDGEGQWHTLRTFTDMQALTCTLGPLEPFTTHVIRVAALGGHTLPDSEFAATPASVEFTTSTTTMYATIWVLKDLDIWSDTDKTQSVGKATTDKSYCVAGEEDGFFLIYTDGARGYVDSTYCLINLPDYMGDLASYNITNSYDSIYMVHDYGIPTITGVVTTGYEEVASGAETVTETRTVRRDVDEEGNHIDLPEGEELYESREVDVERPTEFLVPLLYPTAKKIVQSALAAQAEGYRLKIYDSYRPYIATRYLYDLTESLLESQVPEALYAEMAGAKWEDYVNELFPPEEDGEQGDGQTTGGDQSAEAPAEEPSGGEGGVPEDGTGTGESQPAEDEPAEGQTGEGKQGEDQPEPRPTYYTVMTNGTYKLNAFLAKSGSYHNMGIAVDLTLESIETGEELVMQTAMHDLSWNSVLAKNNDNAKLLARFMTGSNLGTLSSEWWHFQDDELRGSVKDLVHRQDGVTRAGWTADNNGWRYRTAEGTFLTGGTYEVDGYTYTFDSQGYSDYTDWELPDDALELPESD